MTLNTIEMLNSIRNSASTEYQTRIDVATRDNLAAIGQAFITYTTLKNEFTGAVGKIALQLFTNRMWKNKLAQLKSGSFTYGSDIEEFHVEPAKGHAFDPEGTNPLTRKKPQIDIIYHRKNWSFQYDVSISDEQIREAFTSESKLNGLVMYVVNSLYDGAEWDEYTNMKNLLATYKNKDGDGLGYADYQVPTLSSEANCKQFLKTVRKAVSDLTYKSKLYNAMGVTTHSDRNNLVLLIHKDVIAEIDVEVLAKTFHLGKVEFEPTIIEVDDFGSMTDTYGLLLDKDFFRVYDILFTMETIRNPKGLFTNYYLTVQQIYSASKFRNAIRFTTATA